MTDVLIIGAGVSGCALAYELSRYQLDVCLLDKENDVSMGCSRANTAIVHGGYDPDPNTLMGRLNTDSALRLIELTQTLDVEFKKTGCYVVGFDEEDRKSLEKLYQRGLQNHVKGMEIIDGDQVRQKEPNLSAEVVAALWIPESGIINPWELTLAFAEVACREGVTFHPNQKVVGLKPLPDGGWQVQTETDTFEARYVVNAAGVYSDQIHNLVAEPAFKIVPTRGQYDILDQSVGDLVHSPIFQVPSKVGKGVLVSPSVHGNILIGPDAEPLEDPEDTSTTQEALEKVVELARRSVPDLPLRSVIRTYAGIRPNSDYGDFFIQVSAPHFVDIAAIKSPGLTCAPGIADYARDLLAQEGLQLTLKSRWDGTRKIVRFKEIPEKDRAAWIKEHPLFGRVICRCETITEGEIVAACHRPITPVSLDGIKRRTGSGMGRCQGGFCGPRILSILARETGISPEAVLQDRQGSEILIGETKDPEVFHDA